MANSTEQITDQKSFLETYPTARKNWDEANISWQELEAIRADYIGRMPTLQTVANGFSALLQTLDGVHSTRVRLKDPDHLLEKIVRKRADKRDITLRNYRTEITDLIGARALHLFKTDWPEIHWKITDTWEQHEKPMAKIRVGDDITLYTANGVAHEVQPAGYRSVHYGLQTSPTVETYFIELQVRTIFEEAWGEIDHSMRYPYATKDPLLNAFCLLLNNIAGSADEMARLIQVQQDLSRQWREAEKRYNVDFRHVEEELKETKSNLETMIEKSEASEQEKRDLLAQLQVYSRRVDDGDEVTKTIGALRNMMVYNINPMIDPASGSSGFLIAVMEAERRIRAEEQKGLEAEEKPDSEE